ncbi:zinc ribbon domain-containing protein YjdM [Chryseobacterium ginsengisoli]|uniref:Zinc ribbon domain-containing protein YjdM n=2 Tax=Chryseobacterium ginsengisoli TaxID=363853 RepID=A0ABP9MFJ6_9FLAO
MFKILIKNIKKSTFAKIKNMSDTLLCPKCSSEFTYPSDNMMVCSQCFYEWNPEEEVAGASNSGKILDSNGNELQDGDSVVVIKDLPVKGAPKPVKAGTKVKNIRLRPESDHNIDCKIDGFGSMALKSEFVKKA